MIAIDWTLGASALIFLITLIGLNRILFKPLFEVLQQRKAATTGVLDSAEDGQELYQSKIGEYEGRLKAERQAGYHQAEESRNATLQQRQSQVNQARRRAEALIAESRAKIEEELQEAQKELKREAQEIALSISRRVLSR